MHVAILYAGDISRESGTSERVRQIAKGLANLGVQVTLSTRTRPAAKGHYSDASEHMGLYLIYMPNRLIKLFSVLKWVVQLMDAGFQGEHKNFK